MKRIVTMGRGGSGKTTFVSLMTKYFIEKGETPILLIDADPDQNLSEMLGIDLKEAGKKTVSELLVETFLESGGTTVGVPPSKRIESKIWELGLYEGKHFDFMAIGTKFIEGCYCLPNNALKNALDGLIKSYQYVIIDSPGGLEHLNRRIASNVDDMFDIIDPSQKSFHHVQRAYKIAKEINIEFNNFYVIGGNRVPEDLETEVEKRTKLEYLGKISYDKEVENYVLYGKSLLDLPETSIAYNSVKKILQKAGY
ncbi:MAG: cobalamin biosynthesis protein [Candidatus Bathyarchaeum sp.]|nr:MAG: cobalamin biosynthesis protein [Candidatus Bathyarchaeum sp.]